MNIFNFSDVQSLVTRAHAAQLSAYNSALASLANLQSGMANLPPSPSDTLYGTGANDVYVNPGLKTILEAANGGIDTVISDSSYSLAAVANVENLTLSGSANIDGTGNTLDNLITGNAGNNVLDGHGGADTLVGGAGDDTYVFHAGVTIVENAGGGVDTVQSSVTVSLAAMPNVEILKLLEPATPDAPRDIDGSGNQANNLITGNSGNNVLMGGGGDDTFDLSAGGADTIRFTADTIPTTFATVVGFSDDDSIALPAGATPDVVHTHTTMADGSAVDTTFVKFDGPVLLSNLGVPVYYDLLLENYGGPLHFI